MINLSFVLTMGINRFKKILRFIRFDDKTTRTFCRAKDKLAPICDIFEKCNKNFRKFYLPGENITIDEPMVGFRGKCPFRQYLPFKPDKYGIKLFWHMTHQTVIHLERYRIQARMEMFEQSQDWEAESY